MYLDKFRYLWENTRRNVDKKLSTASYYIPSSLCANLSVLDYSRKIGTKRELFDRLLSEKSEQVRGGSDFHYASARVNCKPLHQPAKLLIRKGHDLRFVSRPLKASCSRHCLAVIVVIESMVVPLWKWSKKLSTELFWLFIGLTLLLHRFLHGGRYVLFTVYIYTKWPHIFLLFHSFPSHTL